MNVPAFCNILNSLSKICPQSGRAPATKEDARRAANACDAISMTVDFIRGRDSTNEPFCTATASVLAREHLQECLNLNDLAAVGIAKSFLVQPKDKAVFCWWSALFLAHW
jgi:hypothetical protein